MLKTRNPILIILLILLMFSVNKLFSCTTFVLDDNNDLLYGRNFDFDAGVGHISINKRDQLKRSFLLPGEKQLSWVSKYGSVTFNQVGREFPYGGINEAGLIIEVLWLGSTVYPSVDNRYGLMEVQWVQFQLDNFATVNEAAASIAAIRISDKSFAPIHFLIADRTGNTAVIECIDGKMELYMGNQLPVKALANSTYQNSLNFLNGEQPGDSPNESLVRYKKAANMLEDYKSEDGSAIDYSFKILHEVRIPGRTRWSIVYDLNNMAIFYKTTANPTLKTLNLGELDFSAYSSDLYIDIDHNPGDQFKIVSTDANRNLLDEAARTVKFFSENLPAAFRDSISNYPKSVKAVQ